MYKIKIFDKLVSDLDIDVNLSNTKAEDNGIQPY